MSVEDVATTQKGKTPDFYVKGKRDNYTIELKIKDDDPEKARHDWDKLSKGEMLEETSPVSPRNKLEGIIKKGVKQLLNYDPDGRTYRIIWLHSAGLNQQLHNKRFHSTLFGSQTLKCLNRKNALICYYFRDSAFYTWRDCLEAAILSYTEKNDPVVQLCINTLSHRAVQFRSSDIVKAFGAALCDPDKLAELHEEVMIADCRLDRKKVGDVLGYLQTKYQLDHLQVMQMIEYSAEMLL